MGDKDYIVKVSSPPEKGKANREVRGILAEYFDVSLSCVEIISGVTAKVKKIRIKKG